MGPNTAPAIHALFPPPLGEGGGLAGWLGAEVLLVGDGVSVGGVVIVGVTVESRIRAGYRLETSTILKSQTNACYAIDPGIWSLKLTDGCFPCD